MRFGHEYRACIDLIGLLFICTGLIDGLLEDFTVKYFLTMAIVSIYMIAIVYELIWYPRPCNPMLESVLFSIAFLLATFGVHGAVWLFTSILLGRKIYPSLWLAPNIYIDINSYYIITFGSLIAYLAILIVVNLFHRE